MFSSASRRPRHRPWYRASRCTTSCNRLSSGRLRRRPSARPSATISHRLCNYRRPGLSQGCPICPVPHLTPRFERERTSESLRGAAQAPRACTSVMNLGGLAPELARARQQSMHGLERQRLQQQSELVQQKARQQRLRLEQDSLRLRTDIRDHKFVARERAFEDGQATRAERELIRPTLASHPNSWSRHHVPTTSADPHQARAGEHRLGARVLRP